MTYASDLGLKVGSKIKTLEHSDYFGLDEVLTMVVDDGIMPDFEDGHGEVHPFCLTRKWEHYKEPTKVAPKLIWKEMTLEEVKAVQVGDKIRIVGVENKVTYTFNKVTDFGFRTTEVRKYQNTDHDTDIVDYDDVREMKYKFEHLVEETEMNNRLERTKEYDVKLTGEEIAWLQFATARGNTSGTLFRSIRSQFGELKGVPESRSNGAAWDHIYYGSISKWYTELFPVPETEDQRKLRELKEKHAELGKAIDAMEKK